MMPSSSFEFTPNPNPKRGDVPDIRWPSDDDLEIPLLDLEMQARADDLPFVRWGFFGRGVKVPGATYHFYTDDYKFSALWADPTTLLSSGCAAAAEPNFSTNDGMPAAIAVYRTYQKRWLARYWQSQGVRIRVDLCVAPRFSGLNLRGVPRGWQSYMTRGYAGQINLLQDELWRAQQHAVGAPVSFVVYGGGRSVQQWCEEKNCPHVPETMHVFDGRLTRSKADG